MPNETTAPETKVVEDRGDDFTPTVTTVEVELTGEDLAKIGRVPDKAEVAEPGKEKTDAKEPDKAAKEPDKEPEKKPIMVPKARFDEVNSKAKARIAALESTIKAQAERLGAVDSAPDVAALETELDAKSEVYGTLVADGKLEDAKVVMKEINKLNRRIGLAEAAALSNSYSQETRHMDSLESLVGMFKEAFPVFDDSKPDVYKQEYVDYVARLQGGFESAGSSPAEALREAVEVAVSKFGLDVPPEVIPAEVAKADKGAERKTAAIDKALKAAGAQPTALSAAGLDSDKIGMMKIDVAGLTMQEFAALPESTLKRLRGDLV